MSTQRTLIFGALALLLLVSPASASEFSDRLAAWQGVAPAAPRDSAPPAAESVEAAPNSRRLLSGSYTPPMHATNYDVPAPVCGWPGGYALGLNESAGTTAGYGPIQGSACNSCGAYQPDFGPPDDSYAQWASGGDCGSCCDYSSWCCNTLVWARFDVLLWWRQGRDFPPLVTTDPVSESSTTAGILPDATTLFGNGRVGSNMQAGGRADFGWWTDPRQCVGFGDRFFGLGKDATEFKITSLDNPVLAIPFFNVTTGLNDALLVAYPGLRSGEIHVVGTSDIIGNDVYGRFLICRDCNTRLDFLTGWNYTRVADDVQIRSQSTVTEVGGSTPVGTVTNVRDQFDARSEFHGGILGLAWTRQCGCWSTNLLARMSLGNMHETMIISGSTRIAVPGQTPQVTQGGLFTANSNIGRFERDEFTAITEAGLTLGYRFGPCTQFTLGYSFIYWNDILAPASAIDPNVGTSGDVTRPQFTFRHSDYWVQGLNLGIVREF